MAKRKNKLAELNQAHGKEEKFEPTTLDQIWGDSGISRYRTLDQKEYENSLSQMTKTDLREHAIAVGIVPIDNREILLKRLIGEFKRHISKFTKPIEDNGQQKISKTALSILKEGA
jgi:hypothetical protein